MMGLGLMTDRKIAYVNQEAMVSRFSLTVGPSFSGG